MNTTAETRATRSARLDRAGRILIALGATVVVVPAALIVVAAFLISCAFSALPIVAMDIVFVVAAIVTVVMARRGGTPSLALFDIAALIAGTVAFVLFLRPGDYDITLGPRDVWLLFGASAYSMALGAALRLIARRRAQGGR